MILVLPIAGNSTRHNGKPKWMKRHPNGGIMLSEAVKGIDVGKFSRIYIVGLEEQFAAYPAEQVLLRHFLKFDNVETVLLKRSLNQPHTVFQCVRQLESTDDEGLLIKDCDNYFNMPLEFPQGMNAIAYACLEDYPGVQASNKSYIVTDKNDLVQTITEKRVISNQFCVGAYYFHSLRDYIKILEGLDTALLSRKDFHLSHVLYHGILSGLTERFVKGIEVTGYQDWGTQEDWERYCNGFATLFVDIDGVLLYNAATDHSPYPGETDELVSNIEYLRSLDKGKVTIILTTSRDEVYRDITVQQMYTLGIRFHSIIMGLPHARRVLVNDVRPGEEYNPNAIAFSLARDTDGQLARALKSIGIRSDK